MHLTGCIWLHILNHCHLFICCLYKLDLSAVNLVGVRVPAVPVELDVRVPEVPVELDVRVPAVPVELVAVWLVAPGSTSPSCKSPSRVTNKIQDLHTACPLIFAWSWC